MDTTHFEMYVPAKKPVRMLAPKKAHMTITASSALYLGKRAMETLGFPERIHASVNPSTAEMMVWADKNGNLSVTRGKDGKRTNGTVGATDLVRHFDLPKSSRWVELDSAPGRILFAWVDEDPKPEPKKEETHG